jgi:hypothetical protein
MLTDAENPQSGAAAPGPLGTEGSSASDVDLLLGDFTGVREEAESVAVEGPPVPPRTMDGTGVGAPQRVFADEVPASATPVSRRWMLWWIPVVCVPLVGGAVAWLALRRTHETASRIMLGIGIGLGMLGGLLFLRYADVIAGYTAGSKDTVIRLPAKPAPAQPAQ